MLKVNFLAIVHFRISVLSGDELYVCFAKGLKKQLNREKFLRSECFENDAMPKVILKSNLVSTFRIEIPRAIY